MRGVRSLSMLFNISAVHRRIRRSLPRQSSPKVFVDGLDPDFAGILAYDILRRTIFARC
jgi:hypothetical protein